MGYFVSTSEIDVKIPLAKADAALIEMKRINGPEFDRLKRGGSWGPSGKSSVWHSWMPESFDEFTSIVEFLECVGFSGTKIVDDFIVFGNYDNKTGNEDVFLHFLAPFIVAGSYINWRGEDGEMWRQEFDGNAVKTLEAEIHWR